MKVNVNSIRILYRAKRIPLEGVKTACARGWITRAEYKQITGEEYSE